MDRPPHVVRAAADPSGSFLDMRKAGNHPPERTVMKAFVVEHYGKDGLRAADVPEPEVGDSDVLVKVSATSINPLDKMVRNGEFKRLLKYRTPFVLGHDVAGVVTRVGSAVVDFQVGDEVYARPRDLRIGTFAEYIAIDQTTSRASRTRSPCTRRPRCRWCHLPPGRPSSPAPT
ncbi:MAG TPA: alcohol dehydrogenase catalytic domain-containing protein [Solirubrobacteraceae bacterium]